MCGNRESRCPTAAENSPAEVIKTKPARQQSPKSGTRLYSGRNECWSVCLHPRMLGGEHFFVFLHCICGCFSDQMVMFSQALYLKRNRKNDEGWG